MRNAYLIKHSGQSIPEVVAHGPFRAVKQKFVSLPVKEGDELVMIGDGIRTKRRGKTGNLEAYLAIVARENAAMFAARQIKTAPKIAAPVKSSTPNDNLMKKNLLLSLLTVFALTAIAEQDITTRLAASVLAANTTNSTAMSQPIGWKLNDVIVFQVTVATTNANATNTFTIKYDSSNNSQDWQASDYISQYTPLGVATNTTIWQLTNTVGATWLRIKSLGNDNASAVRLTRFNYVIP